MRHFFRAGGEEGIASARVIPSAGILFFDLLTKCWRRKNKCLVVKLRKNNEEFVEAPSWILQDVILL
jgi:hypothetical protein